MWIIIYLTYKNFIWLSQYKAFMANKLNEQALKASYHIKLQISFNKYIMKM